MLSRKKLKTSEIIIALGAMVFFFGFLTKITPLWIAGMAVIVAGLGFYASACRCPKCSKVLRQLSSALTDPGYCPHCGAKLEFDE